MTLTRRRLLAVGGVAALGGCSALSSGGDSSDGGTGGSLNGGNGSGSGSGTPTAKPPSGPVAGAPIPDDPGEHTYATMGTGGRLVTYFGNWKCPNCAEFSTGFLRDIVKEYVEPGDVHLRFRGVAYFPDGSPWLGPDAPRAARAGLAVWNVDPASYWPYHEQVFAEQPPENEEWATVDRLMKLAHVAGVDDVSDVREQVESREYENSLQSTADAAEDHIEGVPTLLIGGETVVPTNDQERTRELLARAAKQTETAADNGTDAGNQSSE